jgi:translation initiation factor IF-2
MEKRVNCELCGRLIPPHAHYIVKIEVLADPSAPEMSSEELEETDWQRAMEALVEEMKQFTAEELEEQVYKRFEFQICRPCQIRFLANPLGKPRVKALEKN